MTALLNADEIRAAEHAAIDAGISEAELMARAGNGIADLIHQDSVFASNAVVLAGPGNNGGDGVVIAARLAEHGWKVSLWCWNRPEIGDVPADEGSLKQVSRLESIDELSGALESTDVLIDAVFGAGSRAELPEDVASAFNLVRTHLQKRYIQVWAVDVPSGASSDDGSVADKALLADVTAMIGLPKVGAYLLPAAGYTGDIRYVEIGLEEPDNLNADRARLISARRARQALPTRRTGVHKRSAGTLLVIGGAPNYFGAPRLTGEAALRSGAGLVSIAAPSSIISSIATAVPELTFVPLPASEHSSAAGRMAKIVRDNWSSVDALAIGPGLGTDDPVPGFLSQLLGFDGGLRSGIGFGTHDEPDPVEPFAGRAVIDADGLNWLSTQDEWWKTLSNAELVLTPHPGELGRLLGVERSEIESDPWTHARNAASKFGHVVVLKYAYSVVATPDGELWVAHQAPVGLATAGSGDVLTGVIGSLLAQGCSTVEAAIAGVRLSLEAALESAAYDGTTGYLASDIIEHLPAAREQIIRSRNLIG